MEKRSPHNQLREIQEIVALRGIQAFTNTARANGFAMGLSQAEMLQVVFSLTGANFFKSMTTYHDHTLWQDVYHIATPVGKFAYIKVSTPQSGHPVIQFKEK